MIELNLLGKSTKDCILLLSQTAEYNNYSLALRKADNASPYEIPKADGELKYACKLLRQRIEEAGISPKEITALMDMLRSFQRSADTALPPWRAPMDLREGK